jgi:hypothetical protein
MKHWGWLGAAVLVAVLAVAPAYAERQPIKGVEGPDIRAVVEPKGTEGPDIRVKIEPKGIEGPDIRVAR